VLARLCRLPDEDIEQLLTMFRTNELAKITAESKTMQYVGLDHQQLQPAGCPVICLSACGQILC
jgi:hypothetical protein